MMHAVQHVFGGRSARCCPPRARGGRCLSRAGEADLDFAYWPLNGTQGAGYNRTYGQPETYGLMAPDWSGYGNPRVLAVLQSLQHPTQGPAPADH